jgi:hypothetical protein
MPTALMIPAALPPGLFGALVDPGTLVAGLGAVVAAVAVGLCVAIARQRPARPSRVRAFTPAAPREALAA